jgi:Putative peptidoglycan binding domain
MKSSTIFAGSFIAALAQVAFADDGQPNRVAQPVTQSKSSAKVSTVSPTQARSAIRPTANLRRNSPALAQPLRRTPVTIGAQGLLRNNPPRRVLNDSQRRDVAKADRVTFQRPNSNRLSYFDALRRHPHERHDCDWWKKHFTIIVFVNSGFYYWDAGYWYPARGYDPAYDYYDYDGPIYTYGNLLPDQVIANVQSALQEEGYYLGPINGSLGPSTRAALARYQRDYGLVVTAAIDQATVESLGLE